MHNTKWITLNWVTPLKSYCDQNFIFLLSSAFESIGEKYYPCQILGCYSNGKFDYFKRNFHSRFAAITRFKNVRNSRRELGQVERDVMLSLHFMKESFSFSSKLPLALELK